MSVPESAPTIPGKPSPLRWAIAFTLFLAAVLNYIDRNVLGLLAPAIQKDLALSDGAYATVLNFFLVGYTLAYLLSGRIVDKIGVRLSMALFVAWWSVSNALTGLAQSARSLGIFRFMMGLGEAGGFTASPKAVSEWFPPAERAVAIGIYSVGSAIGAMIAPKLVLIISTNYGWRWVFAVSPVFGGLWLLLWFLLYRAPAANTAPVPQMPEKAAPAVPGDSEMSLWMQILKQPMVWQLMAARMLTDPVWYFYQFWMPKYLQTVRGLDQKGVSRIWIVFLAADVGFLLGGMLSGILIKRGMLAPASRLRIMLVSACLVPYSLLVPDMPTVGGVLAVGMVVLYAHTAWLGNLSSLIVDLMPRKILGTAFGLIACGSAAGGIFMNQIVAWLINHRSYNDCFYLMAIVHPIAILVVWRLGRRKSNESA